MMQPFILFLYILNSFIGTNFKKWFLLCAEIGKKVKEYMYKQVN